MAHQIAGYSIVCSTVYIDEYHRRQQGLRYWPVTAQKASNAENVSMSSRHYVAYIHTNSLRPSDAYMRQ